MENLKKASASILLSLLNPFSLVGTLIIGGVILIMLSGLAIAGLLGGSISSSTGEGMFACSPDG
ncbi:MAG: hypothetical protein N2A99_02305, partial [Carnobacterium alterfunditum]